MGAKLPALVRLLVGPFEDEVVVSGGRGIESPPAISSGLGRRGHGHRTKMSPLRTVRSLRCPAPLASGLAVGGIGKGIRETAVMRV